MTRINAVPSPDNHKSENGKLTDFELRIAKKIKSVRKAKGFMQKEIADDLGISQSSYSRVEKGDRPLTMAQLGVLPEIFKISIQEIVDL